MLTSAFCAPTISRFRSRLQSYIKLILGVKDEIGCVFDEAVWNGRSALLFSDKSDMVLSLSECLDLTQDLKSSASAKQLRSLLSPIELNALDLDLTPKFFILEFSVVSWLGAMI